MDGSAWEGEKNHFRHNNSAPLFPEDPGRAGRFAVQIDPADGSRQVNPAD